MGEIVNFLDAIFSKYSVIPMEKFQMLAFK